MGWKNRGILITTSVLMAVFFFAGPVEAKKSPSGCTTLQDGELTYSAGHFLEFQPLQTGYDPFGYNYQGHMFRGTYFNAYSGRAGFPPYEGDDDAYLDSYPAAEDHWAWPYRNISLSMKWNDTWLDNKDCDGDFLLDRHFGFPTYIGSGAWLTNHMGGGEGKDRWTYFIKIVAAPADADKFSGNWFTADSVEIGLDIWGSFAILQEVESGVGAIFVSPVGPGLGKFKP